MPEKGKELVINTGPLIALAAAMGDLSILEELFSRVIVPREVCDELTVDNATRF
jgi:predicted nucleic acid-binding protein